MDLSFLNFGSEKGKESNNTLILLILLGAAFFLIRRYPSLNILQGLNLNGLLGGNVPNNYAEDYNQYEGEIQTKVKNRNRR